MAVEVDTSTSKTQDQTSPIVKSHTVGAGGQNRVIIVGVAQRMHAVAITAITYGGQAMTEFADSGAVAPRVRLFYLVDPPTGANNISVSHGGNTAKIIFGLSLFGVNLDSPTGNVDEQNAAGQVTATGDIATELGDLAVSMVAKKADDNDTFSISSGGGGGGGGGAVEICDLDMNDVTNDGEAAAGYSSANIAQTTHTWLWQTSRGMGLAMGQIKKAAEPALAPVEYFIDAWDPEQVIHNSNGQHVHRHTIRPNTWIRVTGLHEKLGVHYDNFYDDSTVAYIESVTYDAESDVVTIVTNKGLLPEVLLANLAAGSLG